MRSSEVRLMFDLNLYDLGHCPDSELTRIVGLLCYCEY